jgi:predicted esterase
MLRYAKLGIIFAMLTFTVFLSGCGSEGSDTNKALSGTKELVEAEVIEDVNASVMLQVIRAKIDANATNAFGYKALKITYNTKGQDGEDVVASGLLVIPSATKAYQAYRASIGQKPFSVSMLCDNHGTIFTDAEAPTNVEVTNGMPDYSLAVLMTGYAGFASIFPDYIGYGESNGVSHPYILKKASARASLDMIKASMKYLSDNNIAINYQLFVSGYSQGGYTAMALSQEIEKSFSSSVNFMGAAPMAGPYALEELGDKELVASNVMVYPAFLAYLADSYSYYYDDIDLQTLVEESNTTMFHSLFDGSKKNVEIHAALGLTTNGGFGAYTSDKLFKISLIDDYQNSENMGAVLRDRFSQNSVYDWAPKTKVNLIHCVDDEIIPHNMSQIAYDTFIQNGVSSSNVKLTSIHTAMIEPQSATNPFVHSRCAPTAYKVALQWFSGIRSGEIK